MIEGIFGGEESKRHQLHCRFIRWDNCCRFGKIRAIAWNLKVLNRLRYARMLGDRDTILWWNGMPVTMSTRMPRQ